MGSRREFVANAASIVAAGSAFGLQTARAGARALKVGAPAPPATLVTLDGSRISTPELLGSVVILTFWATWCVPCREELPILSAYAAQHAPQGLHVLGFSLDTPDQLKQVRAIAQQLSFPVGLMNETSAPGYGRIWRLPVNFTVGRNGLLIDNGWQDRAPTWTRERLERVITPLLKSPG